MKNLIIILVLLISTPVSADRVLIRLADGVPIEHQSGDAPLGTLRKNHPEYDPADVEERYIPGMEYELLFKEKVLKPELEAIESDRKQKANKAKQALGI